MSGRAGRRGIDDRGIVMLMIDEQMDSAVGKNLLRVNIITFTLLLTTTYTYTVYDKIFTG